MLITNKRLGVGSDVDSKTIKQLDKNYYHLVELHHKKI
ncbi:hypothetical protein VCRA2117O380_60215 [Vibrio crassostreae]|nr:hypothetical protein VCRA2117O379_60076 [Vibrio crassostreae]CAK2175101.1 hypothetical protein VCRA2119O382_60215 [Vibrio crassostreae]CAK2179977.1 hypothetical protein VCRA2117O380_60215 [Vibrio crassostreae]CAK2185508.1 hypothetical protein VCRA2119O381_60066 [Vibrio crassostreae]CAK2474690.1 hypothetical protein VCRA2113O360_20217 [Vibrio crassostreae]